MPAVSRGPEVIAVHVPKTAGSAFRLVLEAVYGKEHVEHDRSRAGRTAATPSLRRDLARSKRPMEAEVERRTSWPRVITGHFPLWKYDRFHRSAFTIVWLREPASRLLSQYFHARSKSSGDRSAAHWARACPPERILEVEWPSNHVTDWFLRGYALDDVDFVGIQEHFAEDVTDLGRMLGWPAVEIPVRARTATPEYLDFRPGEELLQRIRAANQADVELYEQALERRRARRADAGATVAGGETGRR